MNRMTGSRGTILAVQTGRRDRTSVAAGTVAPRVVSSVAPGTGGPDAARSVGRPIMASYVGLVAVIAIVIFIGGVLAGICIIMAAGTRAADRTTMRRRNRALVLRDEPTNPAERGIRRLAGVGQRIGPERDHR